MATKTHTKTHTYTYSRAFIVNTQFALFLRYAGLQDHLADKVIEQIGNHSLEAVGAYLVEDSYRVAEVELAVDWDLHETLSADGALFDSNIRGWKDNVSPEVEFCIRKLAEEAESREQDLQIWVRFTSECKKDKDRYNEAKKLLNCGDDPIPPWEKGAEEVRRSVPDLREVSTIQRVSKICF